MTHCDIAILLGYPEISGGTNVILEHALGLTKRGHRVSIVTELPFDPQRLSWKPAAAELPLLSHADCREYVFDLAIATWWRSVYDLPHVPARWYAYFCQSIESRFFSPSEPDAKALVDYTYRQPLPIVTEATWIAEHLRDYYGRETTLVRNGIDKSVFCPNGEALEPRPTDRIRVLVEGALGVSFKRVEFTIRLCQKAGIEDLWLLTPSPCDSYPGPSRVLSQVPMKDVGGVYRSCDVLVKLSTVEGMFGPPLEMMHCGGTAITTDVSGHEEYMRHGENGIVVRRGEEMEVIRYLQALQRDRAFLDTLKDGARRTADEWPDWPRSVDEMERFVCSICDRNPTTESVQHQMREHLRAALRLAGPLNQVVKPDHSGRELLGMAFEKLRLKIARKLRSRDEPAVDGPPLPRSPARALHQPLDSELPPTKTHYRICFVGNRRRHSAHVPSAAKRAETHFVDTRLGVGDNAQREIDAFGPDCTFVFEPEVLDAGWLAELSGFVIGCSSVASAGRCLDALRLRFPTSVGSRRVLLHMDTETAMTLLEGGVNAVGTFLWPTDWAAFGQPADFAEWCQREIDILYVGPTTESNRPFLGELSRLPGFVQISEPAADDALGGVLARTKMVLHLPEPEQVYCDAAKVVRDMMCGCLVVGRPAASDYGLMPGEHYLFFETPAQLASLVKQQFALPDELDVIRRQGQERARRFDANEAYVPVVERYCYAAAPASSTNIAGGGSTASSRGVSHPA